MVGPLPSDLLMLTDAVSHWIYVFKSNWKLNFVKHLSHLPLSPSLHFLLFLCTRRHLLWEWEDHGSAKGPAAFILQLCIVPPLWAWASKLTTLKLRFLLCNMGIKKASNRLAGRLKHLVDNTYAANNFFPFHCQFVDSRLDTPFLLWPSLSLLTKFNSIRLTSEHNWHNEYMSSE